MSYVTKEYDIATAVLKQFEGPPDFSLIKEVKHLKTNTAHVKMQDDTEFLVETFADFDGYTWAKVTPVIL